MEKLQTPLIVATLFAVLFNALPLFNAPSEIILVFFAVAPVALIGLALRVVKDGKPSPKKWDDYFYEDVDYHRNGTE